jgi:hypothetical protein
MNPHDRSQPSSKPGSFLTWLLLHGLAGMIVVVLFLVVIPRFDKMFQEFGLKLPVISVVMINLTRFFERFFLLIIPTGLLVEVAILSLLFLADGFPRSIRNLWLYGVLVAVAGILLLAVIGLILPLFRLVEGLN